MDILSKENPAKIKPLIHSCIKDFAQETLMDSILTDLVDYAAIIFALETVMNKVGAKPEKGLLFDRKFEAGGREKKLEELVSWTDNQFLESVALGCNLSNRLMLSIFDYAYNESEKKPLKYVSDEVKKGVLEYYELICEHAVRDDPDSGEGYPASPFNKAYEFVMPQYLERLKTKKDTKRLYFFLSDSVKKYLLERETPFDPVISVEHHVKIAVAAVLYTAFMSDLKDLVKIESIDTPSHRKEVSDVLVNDPGKDFLDHDLKNFIFESLKSYITNHIGSDDFHPIAALSKLGRDYFL